MIVVRLEVVVSLWLPLLGSALSVDSALLMAEGEVVLKPRRARQLRGSGEAGDVGDVGSLSRRLPLTLSILKEFQTQAYNLFFN